MNKSNVLLFFSTLAAVLLVSVYTTTCTKKNPVDSVADTTVIKTYEPINFKAVLYDTAYIGLAIKDTVKVVVFSTIKDTIIVVRDSMRIARIDTVEIDTVMHIMRMDTIILDTIRMDTLKKDSLRVKSAKKTDVGFVRQAAVISADTIDADTVIPYVPLNSTDTTQRDTITIRKVFSLKSALYPGKQYYDTIVTRDSFFVRDTVKIRRTAIKDTLFDIVKLYWSQPVIANDSVPRDSIFQYYIYRGLSAEMTSLFKVDSLKAKIDSVSGAILAPPPAVFIDKNVVPQMVNDFTYYYCISLLKRNGYEGKKSVIESVVVPKNSFWRR
jgi:hypothetical protein